MFILGLITAFVGLVIGPIFKAPSRQQAKVDTVLNSVETMYRIQRDLRQGHRNGVFVCQNSTTSPACASPGGALTSAPVLAILTPKTNGTGEMQFDNTSSPPTGQPNWQGYNIYWTATDGQGNQVLLYKFKSVTPFTGTGATALNDANSSVIAALSATDPQTIAIGVSAMQAFLNANLDTIGFKLILNTNVNGTTNDASFESDTVARNT